MQQSMVTHLALLHSKLKLNMSHLKCNSCIFFLKESQEGKPILKEYYCLSFALLTLESIIMSVRHDVLPQTNILLFACQCVV